MARFTDHALLRYIDLSGHLEVELVREAMELSLRRATDAAERLGEPHYLIVQGGLRFVVRNGLIVNVMESGGPAGNAAVLNGPRLR